jgi:hypothetical protein
MHTQIAGLAEAWGCYLQVSSSERKKGRDGVLMCLVVYQGKDDVLI